MNYTEKELDDRLSWLKRVITLKEEKLTARDINYMEELEIVYNTSKESLADVYKQRATLREMQETNKSLEDQILDAMESSLKYLEEELFEVVKVGDIEMENKSTETAATLADIKYDVEMMLYYMIKSNKDLRLFITIDGKQFMATNAPGGVIDFQAKDEHFLSNGLSDEKALSVFRGADELASVSYDEKVSKYRSRVLEALDEIYKLLFESIWNLTPSGKSGAAFTVGTLPATSKRVGDKIELTAGANEWVLELGKPIEEVTKIAQILEEMEKQLQKD